ncbi:MAG: tRNA (adenosine(37)-N6)-dimethylallyltransferase MiaA [bacterium]
MNNLCKKPKLIAIVGPTASGKTNIAIQIAKILNGEIISADSRLVYKDFNIGTAKPTEEETAGIQHYLVSIQSPSETYTVGKYKKEAEEKIKEILNKNKVPIIVGGTGFYIKALLEGLNIPDVDPDEDFRQEMEDLVKNKGKEALYKKLQESDPEMAKKLMPNDSFRIIRALEVQKISGQKMSESQTVSESEYDVLYCGLNAEDRELLYERINCRVVIMLEQGLIKEVETLIKKYGRTVSLLKTLGYKEICEYFDGIYTLEEAVAKIQQNTRKFAKRQLTWFRANKKINWFFIDKIDSVTIVDKIVEEYLKH